MMAAANAAKAGIAEMQVGNARYLKPADLPDSVARPRENDSDPLVDLAVKLIDGLNAWREGKSAQNRVV